MDQQIEAVQRMQDYIEVHLNQEITLAGLAQASLFSPWYSYRIFKQHTGLTPAEYIRRRRLSASALQLRDTDSKIIDVAFDTGFGSVDGYQRAFFREFGCNPGEYASRPVPLSLFTPYGVKYRALKKEAHQVEPVQNVFIQLIEKPSRKVIIKRGVQAADYFSYCEEVGCDVWGILSSIQSLNGEPVCLWLPQAYRPANTSEYVQGAEVPMTYQGAIPEGFDLIELPASKYFMFQGEPFEEENYCDAIVQVQQAVEKYDPSLTGYEWDASSPVIQLEPIGTRGYIELHPVRKASAP
ncbi:MAG: AraC family transcriptional regulator [Oscillospiraceae bacterium]|nr:AraC family transcriptional regulator [Oscillospiraceae bacterium]